MNIRSTDHERPGPAVKLVRLNSEIFPMNRTTALIGLGLRVSACAIALAATAAPVTLKYSPKEGDVLKYKMAGEVQVMGMSATIKADFESSISKVDTDGNY